MEGSKDTALRFLKVPNFHLPIPPSDEGDVDDNDSKSKHPLIALPNLEGYSAVFKPGLSPCLIIKTAASPPQIIDISEKDVNYLSALHTSNCKTGFVFISNEVS